jgi:hypothetical protein
MNGIPRLLIASPHRYPDLARLWHRVVMRELVPAFAKLPVQVEVNIFRDANVEQFRQEWFPGIWFSESGSKIPDFIEFYDATLKLDFDFVFFLDADTFFLNADWAAAQFDAFRDPRVAAISYVPRKGRAASFALLCRVASYRSLPEPVLACSYEFPEIWPKGVNQQVGDAAARELAAQGDRIVNLSADDAEPHVAHFRSTTGIRAGREQVTRAVGEAVFLETVANDRASLAAAYDNVLLGCLHEKLFGEPFACNAAGVPLGGSLTWTELTGAVSAMRDEKLLGELRVRARQSRENILRMAGREGVAIDVPTLLAGG